MQSSFFISALRCLAKHLYQYKTYTIQPHKKITLNGFYFFIIKFIFL